MKPNQHDVTLINKATTEEQSCWFKVIHEMVEQIPEEDLNKVPPDQLKTLINIYDWVKGRPVHRKNGEACIFPHGLDVIKELIKPYLPPK